MATTNEIKPKLTPEQEEVLVDWYLTTKEALKRAAETEG